MTVESDLVTVLRTQCGQVFPDRAPAGTALPWVTYQGIGGVATRHADNTPQGLRNTVMQINVWTGSRLATQALVRQIEEALCAATQFTATPQAEPVSDSDEALDYYGAHQDFDIWSPR